MRHLPKKRPKETPRGAPRSAPQVASKRPSSGTRSASHAWLPRTTGGRAASRRMPHRWGAAARSSVQVARRSL